MRSSKFKSLANLPTLGPDDTIGQGDSFIVHNLLSAEAAADIFDRLRNEVDWIQMLHLSSPVPRLIAVQGAVDPSDQSKPIYRHPTDHSPPLLPFTPTVLQVKEAAEARVGHELNHVLIQLYRNGYDYISEHSDKTLDIVPNSIIVNASFGAQRTMRLRTKKARKRRTSPAGEDEASTSSLEREMQRVNLPHNSLFVLSLDSNRTWLHSIQADKRIPQDRSEAELAFHGERISLTFRYIGTFLSGDESLIWGQGATALTKEEARPVLSGDERETERMIMAFGRENHGEEEGRVVYAGGFDVLHFHGEDKQLK